MAVSRINEVEFTSMVASWINAECARDPSLPFSQARIEQRQGNTKRRDLTLLDRANRPVLTGEVKLPDKPDGASPFHDGVLQDAHKKADEAGVEYFFTWNINNMVLWKTFEAGKPIKDRHKAFLTPIEPRIRSTDELGDVGIQSRIKAWIPEFLQRVAGVLNGEQPLDVLPPDATFVRIWETALEQPVDFTHASLTERYLRDNELTKQLDAWMRDEQGWFISHKDQDVIAQNLLNAALFSCYVFATKIIFHKALRRKFPKIRSLSIPGSITTPEQLKVHLEQAFRNAQAVSRDYETVFAGSAGDAFPLLNPNVVESWKALIDHTDGFDFTKLDFDVIGGIFESILSVRERHKYGQHFTRSEVVDLINAFCIRSPGDRVMDPACGGGTFLVRAYTRKKRLSGGSLTHGELLQQIAGLDVSAYPAHLSTINLATRDLIDDANYPLVVRNDFFKVHPDEPVYQIPLGGSEGQFTPVDINTVDAVVGNPPYLRQEQINKSFGNVDGDTYKNFLQKLVANEVPDASLNKRSDIHCYFWAHAHTFLKDGGYIGLLVASNWLDTTYGFDLQRFLLDHYRVVAIFETEAEPWFVGARVKTTAVIACKEPDATKRGENVVRFVSLRSPLAHLLRNAEGEEGRQELFERLRDWVESETGEEELSLPCIERTVRVGQTAREGMRLRAICQNDLWMLGVAGQEVALSEEAEEGSPEDHEPTVTALRQAGEYVGSKWGILLRAPDIFYEMLSKRTGAFCPLNEIAKPYFGVKSGADGFFFPKDLTDVKLNRLGAQKFAETYGVQARDIDEIRLVEAWDKSIQPVEARYLEPLVFNLMEVDSVEVRAESCKKRVLIVPEEKSRLRGRHVLRYILRGEQLEGFHLRPSCSGRDPWYTLSPLRRGPLLWSMAHQYRHIAPVNPSRFVCNHNMFDVFPNEGIDVILLAAVLNSTIVALSKHQFGRVAGTEGNLKTEVIDVHMMLVPDLRKASEQVKQRLVEAFESMRQRKTDKLVDVDSTTDELSGDLAQPDRQELDDAVLELIGFDEPVERAQVRDKLYSEITAMYRAIRKTEKQMQVNRGRTARQGKTTPASLAAEIWESLNPKPMLPDIQILIGKEECEVVHLPQGKAKAVDTLFSPATLEIDGQPIPLRDNQRVEFALRMVRDGLSGDLRIPTSPAICRTILKRYDDDWSALLNELKEYAEARVADEAEQEKVVKELLRLIRRSIFESIAEKT